VTPEATEAVLDKKVPGISDYIRMVTVKNTERSLLSRGVAGVRKKTLIINLPGSPRGAQESLEAVLDVIPHALEMIQGKGH
jgi:molybdopterin biosynthesis enzyme MoaB